MKASFFKNDVVIEKPDGTKLVEKDVLFFKLKAANKHFGPDVPENEIIVKADESHILCYRQAYVEFKTENPDFKLKWPELDFVVPVVLPEETIAAIESEVEEVLEEEKKPKKKNK